MYSLCLRDQMKLLSYFLKDNSFEAITNTCATKAISADLIKHMKQLINTKVVLNQKLNLLYLC